MNYVFKLRKVTVLLFFKETPPPILQLFEFLWLQCMMFTTWGLRR